MMPDNVRTLKMAKSFIKSAENDPTMMVIINFYLLVCLIIFYKYIFLIKLDLFNNKLYFLLFPIILIKLNLFNNKLYFLLFSIIS